MVFNTYIKLLKKMYNPTEIEKNNSIDYEKWNYKIYQNKNLMEDEFDNLIFSIHNSYYKFVNDVKINQKYIGQNFVGIVFIENISKDMINLNVNYFLKERIKNSQNYKEKILIKKISLETFNFKHIICFPFDILLKSEKY